MKDGRPGALALGLFAAMIAPEARAAAPEGCAHLRLVAGAADARAVLASVSDVVAEDFPSVDAAVAPAFSKERFFAVDEADASCPTAWVVLAGPQAAVRVAGAGRARFVFRELSTAAPLSELDRERIGQVARAALMALQQDAESLDRQHALAAAGVAPPAPVKPAPITVAQPVPAPKPFSLDRYSVGVSYGGVMNRDHIWQGPGLTLSAGGTPWRWDPEVWLDAQYFLPHTFEQADVTKQTIAARVGLSAGWRWLRAGLGAGLNREAVTFAGDSGTIDLRAVWYPAARVFVRATLLQRDSFVASATFLLDAVQSSSYAVLSPPNLFSFYPESFWRPGLSLTLGWRS
jgi:hypothetical protein